MNSFKKMYLPLLVAVLVAGCGDKKDEAEENKKEATQVAAKVNDAELTVHQVNYALQRIPNLDKEQTKAVSLRVVRSLVDQELLLQKALVDKLDRDPAVVQSLDAMRRQILAEAYMARKLGAPVEPSDAEVAGYFDKNPDLFAKRKIYRLQELSIKAPQEKHDAIRAQLVAARTLDDFAAWLKAENITMTAGQAVKTAEQLPLEILPQLAKVPDGQAVVVNSPAGLLVIVVADTQMQPVSLEQAKKAIAQLLQTQTRQKAAKAELDALKAVAKIEYKGEFVDAGKDTTAPVAATPVTDVAAPAAPTSDAAAISKGVSGLK